MFDALERLLVQTSRTVTLAGLLGASLSGCAAVRPPMATQSVAPDEAPIPLGSMVRDNVTPMEASLACFSRALALSGRRPLVIGVGDVKDYTGRYSINEGNVVTQGGALMLISALGKLGGAVRVAERFDPSIGERELGYMDRRQLGNGEAQQVNGQQVPWLPYFGGSIQVSDFYIVGGITEVNYNISSGGFEATVNNIGAKRRTYTQSVAVDLRIVDSRSLVVADSVSLSKQFTGYEVGANTFRFFGLELFDINVGAKAQEPLQLGIRAAIEEAAIRLVARVAQIDPKPCLSLHTGRIETLTSEEYFKATADGNAPAIAEAAGAANMAAKVPQKPAVPAGANERQWPDWRSRKRGTRKALIVPPAAVRGQAPGSSTAAKAMPDKTPAPQSGAAQIAPPASGSALNSPAQAVAGVADAETVSIEFEVQSPQLTGASAAVLERTVLLARSRAGVRIQVVTRDTEQLDSGQRSRLLDQRLAALAQAFAARGIPPAKVQLTWRPDATDFGIYRTGAGTQVIARLKIENHQPE